MAKPELGTKRICPETGRKFYDLNRDPIVSPYTQKSYPLSFFEDTGASIEEDEEQDDVVEVDADAAEIPMTAITDGDDDDTDDDVGGEDIPDIDDDDVDIGDDDDDTFLETDDDEDGDDMSDIIAVASDDDES